MVRIFKTAETNLGFAVKLEFIITQGGREEQLMTRRRARERHARTSLPPPRLIEYLGCGKIYVYKEGVHFRVTKYSDLSGKIIPFFQKYSVLGVKALDFKDFCIAAEMMKNKKHLTQEGLDVI